MEYISILWRTRESQKKHMSNPISEEVFEDLKLKELFTKLYDNTQFNNLTEIMRYPCSSEEIAYRQDILQDFMTKQNCEFFTTVCNKISELKTAHQMHHLEEQKYLKAAAFVYTFSLYKAFVEFLKDNKDALSFKSEGIKSFFSFFDGQYQSHKFSEAFKTLDILENEISAFKNVKVDINVREGQQSDYRASLVKERPLNDKLMELSSALGFDVSQGISTKFRSLVKPRAALLVSMGRLSGDTFKKLMDFYTMYKEYFSIELFKLEDEIRLYLDLYTLYKHLDDYHVPYTKPEICPDNSFHISDCCDISLLCKEEPVIIPNDFEFDKDEHFYILTGANGGGKTTYIRTLGICQLLFSIGAFVPAGYAKMYPFTRIFTHFPTEENYDNVGRLREEKRRVDWIKEKSDADSLVLLNETFSSTDESTSLTLGGDLINHLMKKGSSGIFVTHQFLLLSLVNGFNSQKDTISKLGLLTTAVDKLNSNKRLYKIIKTKPEHLSFAYDILKRYGLTKEQLLDRFQEVLE